MAARKRRTDAAPAPPATGAVTPEAEAVDVVRRPRRGRPPVPAGPIVEAPARYGREIDVKAEAVRLYDRGYSYGEIAGKLDRTPAEIRDIVEAALAEYVVTPEVAKRLKARALRMLEIAYRQAAEVADAAGPTDLRLKALAVLVKVQERESKLVGLDTPIRVDHSWAEVTEADEAIAAAVAAAEAEVARRERELNA